MEDKANVIKTLKKLYKIRAKEQRHRIFLTECKDLDIIPKFLTINNQSIKTQFPRECYLFEHQVLNKYIRKKYSILHNIQTKIKQRENQLKTILDKAEYIILIKKLEKYAYITRRTYTTRQIKKLKFWSKQKLTDNSKKVNVFNTDNIVINLSNYKLNEHELTLLNHGPKHIIQDSLNIEKCICETEHLLKFFPYEERDRIRNNIQNIIEKELTYYIGKNSEDKKILHSLKTNSNLNIINTDKTGKVAILNREDYIRKMEETIEKLDTVEIKNDPNCSIFNKTKTLIKKGNWPDNRRPIISNHSPITPRIFGNLKDHKTPPYPLRPIVNKREGPTYPLEKYMIQIYKNIIPTSTYTVWSTTEFINKIKNIKIKPRHKLVSFDVINLYPSIDTNEINIITNKLIEDYYNDDIDIKTTLQATNNLILNFNHFQFNGRFYRQSRGLPMGSPIASILADFKMFRIEQEIMKEFDKEVIFWCRYVDDVFAILDIEDPDFMLTCINKIDNNIKFTIEKARGGCINFLDTMIKVELDGSITTSIYRKPTASPLVIKAYSYTPYSYKISAFRYYVNRAITVCNNKTDFDKEINNIKQIARTNGFPPKIIDMLLKSRLKTMDEIQAAQKPRRIFTNTITYRPHLFTYLNKEARSFNIKIPFAQNRNIRSRIVNDRDLIDPIKTAGIYKIEYTGEGGNTGCYIGKTKRPIETRVKEHRTDFIKSTGKSELSKLAMNENIKIHFDSVQKIAPYINSNQATIREAVEIVKENNTVNSKDAASLNIRWRNILTKFSTNRWSRKRMTNQKRVLKRRESETDQVQSNADQL